MSPRATVLADNPDARAHRLAAAVGAPILPLVRAREAPGGVIFVAAPPSTWAGVVRHLRGVAARAVVLVTAGEPSAVPEPVARVVLPSQAAARAWAAQVALGRLAVVEPGPVAAGAPGGVCVVGRADRFDPERIVAAARAGDAVVSDVTHEVLPPGAVVTSDVEGAASALAADDARRATLGRMAAAWAARGRRPEDEAAAWRAIAAEVASMWRRGGRAAGL